ncbi:MAG TPA: DUF4349 domain-containing protein [Gaiellaceae bacterium]
MLSPELASELRAARPVASPGLRERVLEVAARERPAREPRLSLPSFRRLALVAVPAALAVAVGGALVHGLVSSGQNGQKAAPAPIRSGSGGGAIQAPPEAQDRQLEKTPGQPYSAVLPSSARLQQYGAYLRLRVEDLGGLSDATKRAMRFARLVGGYVAYVRYSSPSHGQGSASLIVRVPVDRVQDVIAEYSNLGTILSQRINIVDVTQAVEEQAREIARLKAQIARIEAGGVTAQERYRLAELKARLDYLTKHRAATVRRAQFARVSLELATKPKHHAAASTGRFDRTMSDAGGVLLREAEILLYALIVAGPLLLLGGAIIAAGRFRDRRLFERS